MSTRQLITFAGAAVGAFFGAPQLGFVIGSLVGNAVDPVQVFGPRLTDAKIQTARDGIPINWGAGRFRCAGTIVAVQPGPPTEHEHKDDGKGGPEQVTYTYTRTHAILICEGPIIGIRRIWRDQKLVYDAATMPTEASGDYTLEELINLAQGGRAASVEFAERMTIYLGDESQLPDPELEAIFGVGNYPAHRGYAYAVFKDDDVTERGGSISNYEFEVVRAGSVQSDSAESYFLSLGPRFYYPMNDDPCEDRVGNLDDLVLSGSAASGGVGVRTTGSLVGGTSDAGSGGLGSVTACSVFVKAQIDSASGGNILKNLLGHWNNTILGFTLWALYLRGANEMTPAAQIANMGGGGTEITAGFEVPLGTPFVLGLRYRPSISTFELLYNGQVVATGTENGSFSGSASLFTHGAHEPTSYGFLGSTGHALGLPFAVTDEQAQTIAIRMGVVPDGYIPVPGSEGWYVAPDGTYVYAGDGSFAYIQTDTVSLADFLAIICAKSDLTADDIDASDLPDMLDGFLVARETTGAALITVLAQGYFFDATEIDGLLVFVQRGGASVITLDADDLTAAENAPVEEVRDQEIERPRKLNVNYFDPDLAYIPSKQTAERRAQTVAAIGEHSIELPIVLEKDAAAQIADKALKVAWIDQLGTVVFSLPDEFSYLVPTDIVTLNYRSRVQRLRIERVESENGLMMVTTRQDRLSAYDSAATGYGEAQTPHYPQPTAGTIFLVMNLPLLRSSDTTPGVYIAACGGPALGWPGCVVQISYDGGATYADLVTIKTPSVMGTLTADADDASESPASEIISVEVYGTISSVTDAQLDADANAFAMVTADVAEIGQVKTATSTGSRTYDLLTVNRGALGTIPTSHNEGDDFVMLENVYFAPIDEAWNGETLYFRAVTIGASADTGAVQALVYVAPEIIIDGGGDPL